MERTRYTLISWLLSLVCLVAGHRWHTVLINPPKFRALLHLHSQAGCWSLCDRCHKEWNDLRWYGLPESGFADVVIAPPELEYM